MNGERARVEDHEEKKRCTDIVRVVDRSGKMVRYSCGHYDYTNFKFDFYGIRRNPNDEEMRRKRSCGDCLLAKTKKSSIRCASCGLVIMTGEAVAVYLDRGEFRPDASVIERDGERSVLGCIRKDCCRSESPFAGRWTLEGYMPP